MERALLLATDGAEEEAGKSERWIGSRGDYRFLGLHSQEQDAGTVWA